VEPVASIPTTVPKPTAIPTRDFPARIAYVVSDSDRVKSIYVADADGQNSRALPANECFNTDPNWSRDGAYIIYQSNCFGSYDIWRMNPAGAEKQVLVGDSNFDEREASLSPNGEQLLYVRWLKGQDYNQNGGIRILTFGGGDISSGLEGRAPEFSPDGTRIAYMSYDGSLWQIFVYDLATRKKTQITNDTTDSRWPAWSPDGTQIAYNSALGGGITTTGIWVIPVEGGDARQIARGGYGRPAWSDTGWILFNSEKGLWIIHPDGTDLTQLTEDSGQAGVWSR
jgi:Tol biopolymer transport system component